MTFDPGPLAITAATGGPSRSEIFAVEGGPGNRPGMARALAGCHTVILVSAGEHRTG